MFFPILQLFQTNPTIILLIKYPWHHAHKYVYIYIYIHISSYLYIYIYCVSVCISSNRKIDRNAGNLEIWTISIFRQPSWRHTFRHPPPLPPRGIESLHIPHLHPHGLALNDLAATSIVWPYQGLDFFCKTKRVEKGWMMLDDCGFLGLK